MKPFDIKKTLAGDPVMATRTLWVRAYGNKDGDVRLAYSEHQYSDEFSILGAGNGYWNWLEPAKPYEIG